MPTVTIQGIRVQSELNLREHWAARAKRARAQKDIVRAALVGLDRAALVAAPGLVVRFTRVMGRRGQRFDVGDNLTSAFKFCRDAVAEWVGVNDREPFWTWVVNPEQERGPHYAVRIELATRPAAGAVPTS